MRAQLGSDSLRQGFDRTADDYERGRPGWPPEVVQVASLDPTSTVLDLAAGTGKLTRLLKERFERVVAIEPLDGMRGLLEAIVPEAETLRGHAEAIPLPSASVDAIFVAEAFHWFDGTACVAELARVLRADGAVLLMWNRSAGPTVPALPKAIGDRVDALFDAAQHPLKEYKSGNWRKAFDSSQFTEFRYAAFDNPQVLDREMMIASIASLSWISALSRGEREQLAQSMRELLDADEYRRPWRSEVFFATRKPQEPA